ncbi:MAG: S41 family peptidase [Sphaerochaetaceae bacterium]|nr:S41 family peptidase [Sphaerochaetaceae bacterium]
MKKITCIVLTILLALSLLCANGTPEEQQAIFDSIIKNTTQSYQSGRVPSSSAGSEIISRDMASLERLYQYLDKNYLWDIDYDAVYEAMAIAMFDTLGDKYTYYVTEAESEDYQETVSGTYGGLGIYFTKTYLSFQDPEDESTIYAKITQVFPNTPSARAGLKAGDYIIEIDGEPVDEIEATDCAKKMKGDPGSVVNLTIKRNDTTFTLSLTREIIVVPTVEYEMIDGQVAILRILEFSTGTYSSISNALADLAKMGMKKLILDLRDNPGGDVDVTLAIADMFISGSELLKITYKDHSKDIIYKANDYTAVSPDVEVAILINGGTASSAEILSTAMKDNGRATLFGTKSFGKGIMQMISSFGTGYTSITTASFTGPSGNTIHKEGVTPDYEIEEITVLDEELLEYTKLINGTDVTDFVKENPDYTEENISKFASKFADTGLREIVLKIVVRNMYLSQIDYDQRPLADITYDLTCKAAYEYLTGK